MRRGSGSSGREPIAGSGDAREEYGLERALPVPPPLPGETTVAFDADDVLDRLAADLVAHGEHCVRSFGDFHLALCGGEAAEPLYRRLMYDPNYRRLPWRRTHLWLASDEQDLGAGADRVLSSGRQIRETIVDHADIPPDQVHAIAPDASGADARYEAELREALAWREKGHDRLDYVLLVLGADGAIAGLRPGSPIVTDERRLVRFEAGESARCPDCVTMTLPLINAARFVAVLAMGEGAAPILQRIAAGEGSASEIPIRGVQPLDGVLRWYVDGEACAGGLGEG